MRMAWAVAGAMSAVAAPVLGAELLVSSRFSDNVLRYSLGGEFLGVFAEGDGMANPNGLAVDARGRVYVALGDEGRIMRYSGSGHYVDDFIAPGAGGLAGSRAIAFGPNGDLYVASGPTDRVLRYDGQTGVYVGVAAEGFDGPVGLTFGPNGHLFVGAALSNEALEFDGAGNLVRRYATAGSSNATGVLVGEDGVLYVAQSVTNEVLRYDTATGGLIDSFIVGQGLNIPIGLAFMPDGNLIAGSFGSDSVHLYDSATGERLRILIPRGLGGLDGTHNFAFIPGPGAWVCVVLGVGTVTRRGRGGGVCRDRPAR